MKSEPKYKGAGWSLAWLLIFIPVLGWIILFVLKGLEGQTVSRSYAVCNNCGENFRIYTEQDKLEEAKKKKSKRTWLIILLIFCSPLILAIVFAIFSAIFGSIAGIFTGGILI